MDKSDLETLSNALFNETTADIVKRVVVHRFTLRLIKEMISTLDNPELFEDCVFNGLKLGYEERAKQNEVE